MHKRTKLVMTGLAVALLMAAAIGTASAGRLSVSNSRFRMIGPRSGWTRVKLHAT